jgi:hypothetical protein
MNVHAYDEIPLSNPSIEAKHEILSWLENRVQRLLTRVQQEEFWTLITSPDSPAHLTRLLMKEVYLEIVGYQPHVIEAAIAAIGQMPRSMDVRLVRSMLFHQADEFDHGEMALRDFVGLGGDENSARNSGMSPQSFAVSAVWWMIARQRDPFAYIGALYLFEGLTPIVTALVKSQLRAKGLKENALEYIEFHSTEDVKHAKLVNHMIVETITKYPESLASMKYGYECFEAVYPIPVWRSAYERVLTSLGQRPG